jgi:hypothetical protein
MPKLWRNLPSASSIFYPEDGRNLFSKNIVTYLDNVISKRTVIATVFITMRTSCAILFFQKKPMKPQSYIIAKEKVFLQQIANDSSTSCLCKLYFLCIIMRLANNEAENTKTFKLILHNASFTLLYDIITMVFKNSIYLSIYGSTGILLNL